MQIVSYAYDIVNNYVKKYTELEIVADFDRPSVIQQNTALPWSYLFWWISHEVDFHQQGCIWHWTCQNDEMCFDPNNEAQNCQISPNLTDRANVFTQNS